MSAKSSFPALVPKLSDGERYRGKDMFSAVARGLDVIRQQLATLKADNKRLTEELAAARKALKQCSSTAK